MTLEQAIKIVNPGDPYLRNMVRALEMFSNINTPEENERLQAAKIVLRNKNNIKYDGPKRVQ